MEWMGFKDGFAVVFVTGGFAIAIGDFAFVESFEDATRHALTVAPSKLGDLCGGGEGGGEAECCTYV